MRLTYIITALSLLAVPLAAQQTTVLFESDGSSLAPFVCDYGQTASVWGLNTFDGLPAPSIEFTSPNLTMRRAAIYTVPTLGVGQQFRGSLDIKVESSTGHVSLAFFGMPITSSCVYGGDFPGQGSWPIPYLGVGLPSQGGSYEYISTSGPASQGMPAGSIPIVPGQWHRVEFILEPQLDGTNTFRFLLDGVILSSNISAEPVLTRELGMEIGIDGSGQPTQVKFDNIKVEIIEPTPVSCVGFEPPMANGPVTVRGKNRALPLKARLFNESGTALTDVDLTSGPVLQVLYDAGLGGDPEDVSDQVLSAGQGSEGNQFVYTTDGKWQYNLATKNYTAPGTYHLSIVAGDDEEYEIAPACQASFVVE